MWGRSDDRALYHTWLTRLFTALSITLLAWYLIAGRLVGWRWIIDLSNVVALEPFEAAVKHAYSAHVLRFLVSSSLTFWEIALPLGRPP
jgi:hypothetical protein